MDWLPSRMTALGFAIVGSFEDAMDGWRNHAQNFPQDNDGVILAATSGAINIRLGGAALAAADEIFVPIQCEYYALEGLGLLMEVTERIRASGANPSLSISGLLLTMFDSRTNLNPAVEKEVRNHFQEVVYNTVIPRTVRFAEAPSHGRTILEHDPNGIGSVAYRRLAKEFLDRQKKGITFINAPGQ